jgi:hypothetical protein
LLVSGQEIGFQPGKTNYRSLGFSPGNHRRAIMNEHRREILDMLTTGKITADEAERLN